MLEDLLQRTAVIRDITDGMLREVTLQYNGRASSYDLLQNIETARNRLRRSYQEIERMMGTNAEHAEQQRRLAETPLPDPPSGTSNMPSELPFVPAGFRYYGTTCPVGLDHPLNRSHPFADDFMVTWGMYSSWVCGASASINQQHYPSLRYCVRVGSALDLRPAGVTTDTPTTDTPTTDTPTTSDTIPSPPEGFQYWGTHRLRVLASGMDQRDVAGFCGNAGSSWATTYQGDPGSATDMHYALRVGSSIHRANFGELRPVPPAVDIPAGYVYFGTGPLTVQATMEERDARHLISYNPTLEYLSEHANGDSENLHYWIRAGSDLALANGLTQPPAGVMAPPEGCIYMGAQSVRPTVQCSRGPSPRWYENHSDYDRQVYAIGDHWGQWTPNWTLGYIGDAHFAVHRTHPIIAERWPSLLQETACMDS